MFDQNDLKFIKDVMTIKVIDEIKEYKQINTEVERALRIVEAIDPHSKLRENIKKDIAK